ncbi:MAG: sterol desaturase family protein [Owenweeksia sp.]
MQLILLQSKGKSKSVPEEILAIFEEMQLPNLIHYAIPFFVGFIALEVIITTRLKADFYHTKDAASSIAMGLGNVIIGLFSKAMVFGVYTLLYQFRLWELGFVWWAWILCFFADDISYYWFHRSSHKVRFFWASHVIHHSSTKYNLATALRQTWTGNFTGFVFYLWMPLLGFHPLMILFMHSVSLLYQFWIHTEVIQKLPGWFEAVFNTPSHHRVHHASDLKYLDKNHAGILIIWDRMFGTFQPEEERPTYGLTKNIDTYNPLIIATHEWRDIIKDVWRYPGQWTGYVFGPPGWSHDGSRQTTTQLQTMQHAEKKSEA